MTLLADASKPLNRNPSILARFAAKGENGGKAVGLGLCATSITLADRKQEAAARSEYFRGCARFYPDTVLWGAPNAVSNC